MSPIAWDSDLETGDALVDRQHRNLHNLFNDLEIAEGRPEEISYVLERVLEHAAVHFATEEELMQRAGYPEADALIHIQIHRELTESARAKAMEFRSGQLTDSAPLLEFLREWITVHIHEHDRELIEWVRARGVMAVLPGSSGARER